MQSIEYGAANGEHSISGRIWRPEGQVRGIVQLAHGMQEHSGRYSEFAEYLTAQGYLVCANDHAGHGASHAGLRGYMGAKDGYRHMVTDMRKLYELVRAEYSSVPYILFGHSMGSFLARYYCMEYGGLDGVIYSGTGDPAMVARLSIPVCKFFIRVKGAKNPGVFFRRSTERVYNRTFAPARTVCDWLSRDERQVDKYIADELCGFPFTYGGYLELFMLIKRISARDWAYSVPKDLPVYMFSGTGDPVGDYAAGVRRVYKRLLAAGCKDVTLKLYDGGRHEMLNETNRHEVYADTLAWIERVVSARRR